MVGSHRLRTDCTEVGAYRKLLAVAVAGRLRMPEAHKPGEVEVGLNPWFEEDA